MARGRTTSTDPNQGHRPSFAVPPGRAESLGGSGRVLAGVASTVAGGLGIDPLVVRLCLIALTVAGGWGILFYLVGWLWVTLASPTVPDVGAGSEESKDLGAAIVTFGVLLFARDVGVAFVDELVWPVALVLVGVALVWRRVGDVDVGRWIPRTVAGLAVVLVGAIPLLGSELTVSAVVRTIGGLSIVLAGVSLMFAPTLRALATELVSERSKRIRSDERALISAHLHDSVLQTLALIQKRSGDPKEVATLARQQERQLREWLYDRPEPKTQTLKNAISQSAAEVESMYRIPVNCVVVGDAALDEGLTAVAAATREAVVNAAKFSGADLVDVYAEVRPDTVEVFIRDRGCGFDPEQVGEDRKGIVESIVGRVERFGGMAQVRSTLGEGTEVSLRLPVKEPRESVTHE